MKKTKKILWYGFLTWLVPFLAAIPFYNSAGELKTDIFLFKSIMLVLASLVGAVLIVRYFKSVKKHFFLEGLELGAGWLLVNVVLDVAILVMMMQMPLMEYIYGIGLRYLVIPITTGVVGKVAEMKK